MRQLIIIVICLFLIILSCIVGTAIILFWSSEKPISNHNFPLQKRWEFRADEPIQSSPTVYEGRVVFRTMGNIYAIDEATGHLIWSVPFRENIYPAPPFVENGIVVVSSSSGTVAFDLDKGERLWESKADTEGPYVHVGGGNQEVVVIVGGYISVHNLRTGSLLWRIPIPGRSTALTFLEDQYLYTVFGNEIRGYDLEQGKLLWEDKNNRWGPWGIMKEGILYLDHAGNVGAFSIDRRERLWLNENIKITRNSFAVGDELLLIGIDYPVALGSKQGQVVWKSLEVQRGHFKTPLVVGESVFIQDLFNNRLYALSLKDGSLIGYLELGRKNFLIANDQFPIGPINTGKFIIFSEGETLYAYGPL